MKKFIKENKKFINMNLVGIIITIGVSITNSIDIGILVLTFLIMVDLSYYVVYRLGGSIKDRRIELWPSYDPDSAHYVLGSDNTWKLKKNKDVKYMDLIKFSPDDSSGIVPFDIVIETICGDSKNYLIMESILGINGMFNVSKEAYPYDFASNKINRNNIIDISYYQKC